jgi:hypothetical protein
MFRPQLSRLTRGRSLGPLLLLNTALGAVLIAQHTAPVADAQPLPQRARGDYAIVSGRTNVGGADTVAILDAANQEIAFLRWDQSRQQMSMIAYRNLTADNAADPGR